AGHYTDQVLKKSLQIFLTPWVRLRVFFISSAPYRQWVPRDGNIRSLELRHRRPSLGQKWTSATKGRGETTFYERTAVANNRWVIARGLLMCKARCIRGGSYFAEGRQHCR